MNRLGVMAAMTLRVGLAILTSALPAFANKSLGEVQTDQHRVRIVELADNLEHPWSMAFLPDGGFLVTERPGRLWRFSADGRKRQPISGLPDVYASGQGGLLDIVASPDFADSQTIYLSYAAGDLFSGANTRLARARLSQNRLENLKVLFSAQPNHQGGLHFGGRIVVLSDGSLTLTIGERGQKTPAQDLMDHSGSVIRVMADGQVPADNPFVRRSDALPEI
jgi:glucose/arabinose dehydrogenase